MSFVGDFLGDTLGGITGAKQAGEAAQKGAELQFEGSQEGIAETRRQFDKLTELMAPFVSGGSEAFNKQLALSGGLGADAEREAIEQIQNQPSFQYTLDQGEQAILQNAAATGGLRGGNTQRALGEFRPQLLSNAISNRFNQLGGLSALGQASAAGQGAAGTQSARDISNLLAQGAAARAGGAVAQGATVRQTFGDLLDLGNASAKAAKAIGGF